MATSKPLIVYYDNSTMLLEDAETVKSWPIGRQLVYALQVEQHYPLHSNGASLFVNLIKNLGEDDMENITADSDTVTMFAIVVTDDNVELLSHILNHPFIPNSSSSQNTAKRALKKAMRVGSVNALNYLIQQNVMIFSSQQNTFDDLKSFIFNILKAHEIGSCKLNQKNTEKMKGKWVCNECDKQNDTNLYICSFCGINRGENKNDTDGFEGINVGNKNNNIIIANRFWNYLAKSLQELYQNKDGSKQPDNLLENWRYGINDKMGDSLSMVRCAKFMIRHPLVQYAICKYIETLVVGNNYSYKLLPILQFICEHYGLFDDEYGLKALYAKCKSEKLFDCSKMIEFKLSLFSFFKDNQSIQLFWSGYIVPKLINDMVNVKKKADEKLLLYCIRYILSNGAANHYKKEFVSKLKQNNNKTINNLCDAVEHGKNIWILKKMQKNDMVSLFSNICNKKIQIPTHIIRLIISFLVL